MIKIEGKKFDWFGLTQILKEHKGKLRQIRMLSVNELKKKYKGAALGLYFRMYRWRIEVNKKQQAVCNKAVLPCFKHHDLYFTFGTLYPHFAVCYNVCGAAVSGLWTEYLQSSVYLLCADDVFFLPCAFVDDCSSKCVQQGF